MGAYASHFQDEGDFPVSSRMHPSKSDWITSHAVATELAIVEVDRLWLRFQQLGCNEDGVLEAHVLNRPPASNNIYAKHIISSFIGKNDRITFFTFLNAMKWAETADQADKVKAIFNLLNNSKPVRRENIYRVLKRVYPDDPDPTVQKLSDIFMDQIDDRGQGYITQYQFQIWVEKLPQETLDQLLGFSIVPEDITLEAHRMFSGFSQQHLTPSQRLLSDSILDRISEKVHRKDWHLLANALQFSTLEQRSFELKHPRDSKRQVFEMLTTWKRREGENVSSTVLQQALKQCDMNDAAVLLSLNF